MQQIKHFSSSGCKWCVSAFFARFLIFWAHSTCDIFLNPPPIDCIQTLNGESVTNHSTSIIDTRVRKKEKEKSAKWRSKNMKEV